VEPLPAAAERPSLHGQFAILIDNAQMRHAACGMRWSRLLPSARRALRNCRVATRPRPKTALSTHKNGAGWDLVLQLSAVSKEKARLSAASSLVQRRLSVRGAVAR
jgi:hypothetical protein